ncbi:MAG: DUF4113 domain-containing protein, partial [bacterium]
MKAGVILGGLVPKKNAQLDLNRSDSRDDELMEVLDEINDRFGKGTLHPAASGFDGPWTMDQSHHSPHYTTRWNDLPEV